MISVVGGGPAGTLIAILLALYSGKPAREILSTDAIAVFDGLSLRAYI